MSSEDLKVLKVRKYRVGYEVRVELVKGIVMKSAYNEKGEYIGSPKFARYLYKRGIKPEKIDPRNNVCSIGFCEKEQKWYGWSHRAIYGFGIGCIVKEGDCAAEYLPVGFRAETLEDCKKVAIAFANSVS